MNAAIRRSVIAVALIVVVVGGWVGLAPSMVVPDSGLATVPSSVPVSPSAPPSAAVASPSLAVPGSPEPSTTPVTAAGGASASPSAAVASPTPAAPSDTPALSAALDARLEQLRAKSGIPGVSVAIIFADGSVWRGNAGLADVAAGRPATSDTAFAVASVSKTFTAALILALIEDGRLSLDSTAKTFLPTVALDPAITVRELLDHTSGLRDFYYGPGVDKALLGKPAQVWDAKRSLKYVGKPFAKPGVAWHYSNTNYLVLGLLAEAVGGAPLATQLRTRFFDPLGLDRTWFQAVDAPRTALAVGYRFTGADPTLPAISLADGSAVAPFTSVVTASGGAGSIATTASDLARWAADLYGGDALQPASRDAITDTLVPSTKGRLTTGYGLGAEVIDIGGRRTYGHAGRFLGARVAMRWLPVERVSIAVMTNQSRTDPNGLVASLLKVVFPPPPACPTCVTVP